MIPCLISTNEDCRPATVLKDEMNTKNVYVSYTIIVYRYGAPTYTRHLVPKGRSRH